MKTQKQGKSEEKESPRIILERLAQCSLIVGGMLDEVEIKIANMELTIASTGA